MHIALYSGCRRVTGIADESPELQRVHAGQYDDAAQHVRRRSREIAGLRRAQHSLPRWLRYIDMVRD